MAQQPSVGVGRKATDWPCTPWETATCHPSSESVHCPGKPRNPLTMPTARFALVFTRFLSRFRLPPFMTSLSNHLQLPAFVVFPTLPSLRLPNFTVSPSNHAPVHGEPSSPSASHRFPATLRPPDHSRLASAMPPNPGVRSSRPKPPQSRPKTTPRRLKSFFWKKLLLRARPPNSPPKLTPPPIPPTIHVWAVNRPPTGSARCLTMSRWA